MQEAEVVGDFLFPANQQPTGAVDPRVSSFNHPAAGFGSPTMRCRGGFPLARDVDDVATAFGGSSHGLGVVAFVRTEVLSLARRRFRTADGNAFERFSHQRLVMHIGPGDRHAQWHAATVGQRRAFDAEFAAIGGVFPRLFPPPRGAFVIAPSKLCHCQSMPTSSSYSSKARCHNFWNTPRRTHS